MSPPSVTTSSSSKLNQFGLYRTIDERTEEFLKLSRKRQMRQGCVCAAISTAITVTIVVSILLLYEYHVVGYRVLNRRVDANYSEELKKKNAGKDTKKLAMLPSLLNVLNKRNEDESYEDPKHSTTDYSYKKGWFADLTSKIKPSTKGTGQKTSPIIFLKAPLGRLDFYSKARETKTKNAISYIDRRIAQEYQPEGKKNNISTDETTNSLLKVRQAESPILEPIKPKSLQIKATQHSEHCTCTKSLQELIRKLIESIQKLVTSTKLCPKPQSVEIKHQSCCQEKTKEKYVFTTDNASEHLELDHKNMRTTPINEIKSTENDEELRNLEENINNVDGNNVKNIKKYSKSDTTSNKTDLTPKTNPELFEEYLDYISKRHSSTTTDATTAVIPETTSATKVASFDVQMETVNKIETSTKPEDKKYVYIAKINNPRIKTTTSSATTTTIKPFLFTETIKPPNQPGNNYNKFLKVLQEYKYINDHTDSLFSKNIVADTPEPLLMTTSNNETFVKSNQNYNNKTVGSDTNSEELKLKLKDNIPLSIKKKVLKVSASDYIKLVNGNHNLHSLAKKHNSQYLSIVSGETNNAMANTTFTTATPNSENPSSSVQVIQIQNQNSQRLPYGIYRETETKSEKPETVEDLEIDDQMQINDGSDSIERKKFNQRFGYTTEYSVQYAVSKLLSGRPSYLEISSKNDWSPHFDEEVLDP